VLVWSYLSVFRLYTFQASVFDLGVFAQSLKLIVQGNVAYDLYMLGLAPFRFFLFPFGFYPDLPALLILQTVFLALPVFPLYATGKKVTNNRFAALLVSSSYLVFFSLAGVNWFDVHGQAFFIFFFVIGYYFFITKRYRVSILFFLLSGMVRFPYMIFPLLFALFTMVEIYIKNRKRTPVIFHGDMKSLLILCTTSLLLLVVFYRLGYYSVFTPTNLSGTIHASGGSIFTNIDAKISTVLIFLSPFLFISIRKPKWGLLLLPFFTLVFLTNNSSYLFPNIITDQYSVMVIPFLYLGFFAGLTENRGVHSIDHGEPTLNSSINKGFALKKTIAVFVFIVILAVVFQPYSPISKYSEPDYISNVEESETPSSFLSFNAIVDLIPSNDPYVLMQNNMPEVVVHDPSILNVLEDYVFGFPYNLTYELPNGTWTDRIDYVIADSNSNTFYQSGAAPYNTSMYEVLNRLYSTGDYGIMAEEYGFILLKRNYTGPIIYYHPISEQFGPDDLDVLNSSYRGENVITGTNPGGHRIWFGPTAFLVPGQYRVTFYLSTTNNSIANNLKLWIGDYPIATFREITLTGSSFQKNYTVYNITANFSIENFYNQVQFAGLSAYWNGSLSIYGIQVKQISNEPILEQIVNLIPSNDPYVPAFNRRS